MEQNRFRADENAPILPAVGTPLVGVHGPILTVITANDGECLNDRVVFVLIEPGCFPEPLVKALLLDAFPECGGLYVLSDSVKRDDKQEPACTETAPDL